MAVSTSGTNIVANAALAARHIAYEFLVNWADDAAGFSGGTWTDESGYVVRANGVHEAVNPLRSIAPLGRGVADRVTVVCRNPEAAAPDSGLRFSPSNTSGPLYGYIGGGGMYMKRAQFSVGFFDGATPECIEQITGYIVDVQEDFENRTITFIIRDRAADAALTQVSTALYNDTTAKDYLEVLASLFERDAVGSGDQEFDLGFVVTPYQWADGESIWDEMGIVAEAQGGRIWFDKSGDLHFDDAAHWIKPNSTSVDDPLTSQATLTVASFANLQPKVGYESIYNHVVVEYQPRYVGGLQTVYSSSEIIPVLPSSAYTSGHYDFRAEFRYPVQEITANDVVAVTAGGTDISSDLSISRTDYASHSDIEITNSNSDYAAYLTQFDLVGYPVLTEASSQYECEDATSIAAYGKRTLMIRGNPYIQTYRHAQAVAEFLLARFKNPVQRVELAGIPARPWLEVGDRVTVTEALTEIDEDYFLERIDWSFDGKKYTMGLGMVRAAAMFPESGYFIVGTSAYGTNARLFW